MAVVTVGRIENEVGFSIDRRSWKTLDKYQKRISQLKEQLKSLPSQPFGNIPGRGGRAGSARAASGARASSGRSRAEDLMDAHIKNRQKLMDRYQRRTDAEAAKATTDANRRQDMISAGKIRSSGAGGFFDRSNLRTEQITAFKAQLADLARQFKNGDLTSRQYSASVSNVQANMSRANREFKTFNRRFREMRTLLVAGGIGYAGLAAAGDVVRTGQQFEATEAKMLIGTGSPEKQAEAIKFVRSEVQRLGLDLLGAQDSFARLSIASKEALNEGQVKELYSAFSELGVAAKIDPERMKLGMRLTFVYTIGRTSI